MALTARQLERRKHSLGGSDIAVLLGHSPRSQYDLWLEKKHGVVTFEGNDQTEFGQVVEPAIADWAAKQLGVTIRKNAFRSHPTLPFHANLDAVVVGKDEAIEVKTTSYQVGELWGEPGTDEVPHAVICQAQWQAQIAELERVHVAAGLMPSFGGQKLRLYPVERHEELGARLLQIGAEWWDKYVEGSAVPSDEPSEASIKAVVRVPNLEVKVDGELVRMLIEAKAAAKLANDRVKKLTTQVHAALYDKETGQWAEVGVVDESTRVTYFEHYRKAETKPRAGGYYRRLVLPKEEA